MKRRIIFVVALLLIAMVAPCAAINLEVTLQPAVSGSHVNNVLYALEEKGIPIPEAYIREDSNGNTIFEYASINYFDDSSMLNYSLTANEDKMISYAVFNVSNAEAPWYLPFCASMPYTDAEQEKVFEWVKENCNQESTCQIGNAIFDIYPNKNGGAMLTITAEGYTEWCMQEMLKMYPAF